MALDNLADSVTIHDASGKLLYVNEATSRLMGGQSVEDILSAAPGAWRAKVEMYDEHGEPLDVADMPGRQVFQCKCEQELLVRRVGEEGDSRWVRIKAAPLFGEDGDVAAAVNVSEDVTDVKEAELFQRLLAEAGDALAASLDYEQTLQQVAEMAVPDFADWVGVDLLSPAGELELVALAHADPEKIAIGHELRERYPTSMDDDGGTAEVIRTGEPQLVQEIPDELLAASAVDEEHLMLMRGLGLRSVLIVPLRFGDEVIGTMSFVLGNRRFSDADVVLARALARRAVMAIENSRLYTERATIAQTLQDGLLPPTLEPPPGWEVAVLFRAAGSANEVGGDFYDVVRLEDGWISFIGDVTGKGAAAAAITARARYTMISVAQLTGQAVSALERVNLALTDLGGLPFCTVACTQFRGAPGKLDIMSAGHPLPYLVGSDGVAAVGESGPLLGFDPEASWGMQTVSIEPGETIVLFSDGVTDALGPERESYGEKRLEQLLFDGRNDSAAELIERLDRSLLDFQDSEQRDDIAVLALRRVD
ncbi:MAG TPA: SpoIIE family protein phosphatase [Thermoleophilaceae bacterium]